MSRSSHPPRVAWGSRFATTRIVSRRPSTTRDFEKTMMFSSSLEWNRMLRSQRSAGCALRMALSLVRYRDQALARLRPARLVVLPVPVLVLVLLVVDLLLRTRPRDVLHQLVARVDAPGRHQGGGQDGAHRPGGRPAVLHVRREDVVRRRPERRTHVGGRLPGQLGEVLLELRRDVAPGEVGVRLVEPDLGQRVHHRRLRERLGQEDDLGVVLGDVGDEPLPELTGFVCGLSTRNSVTPWSIHTCMTRRISA